MTDAAAGVPWEDPLQFCESADAAVASAEGMFRDGWRNTAQRVYAWARDAGPDPFAATVRLALDREVPAETARGVFRSLCDHWQSLFAQKATAIIGWAEATAGLGPTGDPCGDIALWTGAWAIAGEAPPSADIHRACLPSILQALRNGGDRICPVRKVEVVEETGIRMCDEFLQLLGASPPQARLADPERAIFAVSALKDSLTVAESLYSTYKGFFGGVLDILYWPAMAECAGMRIRASLAVPQTHLGDGTCEHKTSSAIPQAASLTQEAPQAFSA